MAVTRVQEHNVDTGTETRPAILELEPKDKHNDDGHIKHPQEDREQYDNLFQYLLACIGFAVGLGNVWRFPKVCLENGGGAFIIPWFVVLIIQGIPLMLVELSIGQRFRAGPVHAFGRMNKFMWGVGASMFFASLYTSLFYNSILSWAFLYFFNSFTRDLPWLTCPASAGVNNTACIANPAKYYFINSVLNPAPAIDAGETGIVWPLYFATVVAWLTVFLAMMVGVKSVGKVVYFTALYPYLMLTILLIIGVTSDGAEHGLEYLWKPDWSKIGDFRVWQAASEQVFFSASLAFGGLIAMASYMPVENNAMRDSLIVLSVNSGTSIFASIGIFSIKGHMAKDEFTRCQSGDIVGCNVTWTIRDYVADSDSSSGLIFISMAKALDVIGEGYGATTLSLMFYLMIISLGLDSAFGALEGYLAVLKDFGLVKKFGYKRVLFACVAFSIVFALLFSSHQGTYFIDIFDKYGVVLVLVFVGLFEFIAVGWVYGFHNFVRDFKIINRFDMNPILMVLIKYVGPLSIMVTLVGKFTMEAVDNEFLHYKPGTELVAYPGWAGFIAMMLFLSAVLWFPVGILVTALHERYNKSCNFGQIDFDYNAMVKELPVKRFPKWQRVLFFLDEYDFPENL